MPADRTSFAQNRKERGALASRIDRTGFEMFPCSGCDKRNVKCVVSDKENSGRCSECVLRGVKCDVEGIPVGEWRALEMEEDRLEKESEAASRLLAENLRLAQENSARLARLEKQKKFLKSKGKDMLRRGLKTLDELEEAEEKERQAEERSRAAAAAIPTSAVQTQSDPFAGLEVPLLPPEVWDGWDFGDGTLQASQGT
jgi:hypothetical protein